MVGGKLIELVETLEKRNDLSDEEFLQLVEKHFDREFRMEVERAMDERRELNSRDSLLYEARLNTEV